MANPRLDVSAAACSTERTGWAAQIRAMNKIVLRKQRCRKPARWTRVNVSAAGDFSTGGASLTNHQPTKSAGVVVTFFAVFSEVEASHFNFFARTQSTEDRLHDVSDDDRSDDGQSERYSDGFDLLDPE